MLLAQHQQHQQPQQAQQQHSLAMVSVPSLQDRKKDIIAEAMREEKIFDEMNSAAAKKTVLNTPTVAATSTSATAEASTSAVPTVSIKSEPSTSAATPTTSSLSPVSTPKPGTSMSAFSNRGRGIGVGIGVAGRLPMRQQQQQIIPRLQLLDDEDDGLTCRMCLQQFWYKSELHDHLKGSHSISDPDRYEREEREKKIRRIREEQLRYTMTSRGRAVNRGRGVTIMSRGVGTIRGRGVITHRPPPLAGPRPSFQYRDGSFICDLCKKSFSDGNDMVSHWKSHVKQQSKFSDFRSVGRQAKTHMTSRGRPITKKQAGKVS